MRLFFKNIADFTNDRSVAARCRAGRHALFRSLIESKPKPLKILDLGGTQNFWETTGLLNPEANDITLLNVMPIAVDKPGFRSMVGDARSMPEFENGEFDVVFSNSVIEHVGTYDDQRSMAREIKRVGHSYFVQTPNRYFPIEPHTVFPLFQFLPIAIRAWLLNHFSLGWFEKIGDREQARELAKSIRLLTGKEFADLFPDATFEKESFLGMTKSFIVYGGWNGGNE
ncbi:MAG: methyltransferase domain-containing protein [Actinobacteria bacterium]|nr:methyltransferase domain-containing protein [Actinomycetota bacterium]